jgi:single-strand DNA-binding protein
MNKCLFIGRLTANPEERNFDWGSLVYFCVAIDRKYKNKDGTKTTDYIDFKATNKMAEIVAQYFKKGDLVYVVAEAQKIKIEKDGVTRYLTQFNAIESRIIHNNKKIDRDGAIIPDESPF